MFYINTCLYMAFHILDRYFSFNGKRLMHLIYQRSDNAKFCRRWHGSVSPFVRNMHTIVCYYGLKTQLRVLSPIIITKYLYLQTSINSIVQKPTSINDGIYQKHPLNVSACVFPLVEVAYNPHRNSAGKHHTS